LRKFNDQYEHQMNRIKYILLFFSIIAGSLFVNSKTVGDIPVNIFKSIEAGDVESLSNYFSESIELILVDKEGIYSKTQAKQILKQFFNTNRPKKFNVLHQGGSENAKYAIGTLITTRGKYRLHFLVKIKNNKALIHQLRIQEEE
jgi:acetylglutamate synthase